MIAERDVCGDRHLLGPESAVESLREALAMGVNHAIHLQDAAFDDLDASSVARVLAAAVKKVGEVDVVFVGKQTIDTNTAASPSTDRIACRTDSCTEG